MNGTFFLSSTFSPQIGFSSPSSSDDSEGLALTTKKPRNPKLNPNQPHCINGRGRCVAMENVLGGLQQSLCIMGSCGQGKAVVDLLV